MTPEVRLVIKARLEQGDSLAVASRMAGLLPQTVQRWVDRGRGRISDRPAAPEYVQFVELVEDARASLNSKLAGWVIRGAEKDPQLALKLLERFDPEHWGPRVGAEEPEDEPLLTSPAIAQPELGPGEEEESEPPDGAVTLRERTVTIPVGRIEEFVRMVRGDRKAKDGDGDDDLAGFHEGSDLPSA